MFYENFERICRERGVSPSGALIAIGENKNKPSNWKKFGTVPKQHDLDRLASYLDCSVADFFEDGRQPMAEKKSFEVNTPSGNHSASVSSTLDINQQGFMDIYNRCSNIQRAKLMTLVYEFEVNEL